MSNTTRSDKPRNKRRCPSCKQHLPLRSFYSYDGVGFDRDRQPCLVKRYTSYCKDCSRKNRKVNYAKQKLLLTKLLIEKAERMHVAPEVVDAKSEEAKAE